jgi:hypothetical protein
MKPSNSKRVLDSIDRVSEVLFGLIHRDVASDGLRLRKHHRASPVALWDCDGLFSDPFS